MDMLLVIQNSGLYPIQLENPPHNCDAHFIERGDLLFRCFDDEDDAAATKDDDDDDERETTKMKLCRSEDAIKKTAASFARIERRRF